MQVWIAQVPFVEGEFGTGPVDLYVATSALNGPAGFDVPGGSGYLFNRAMAWFAEHANSATSNDERHEHIIGAVKALNNLAVWCMTEYDSPDRGQSAMGALERAVSLALDHLDGTELYAGVLFNIGILLGEIGEAERSGAMLREAARLGVE